ncbi:FAD/NAD(P)-binding domain-containing protein [Thozetella sp. PMI_491]|nr:FAD/NAD(P)-binding domain-containing protein [Thozetella sp. PMI_491]
MPSSKNFELAVIGGGIAGLTLAIALHKRDLNVNLYEQAHHFREIGAGVSFSPNAVQAMDICGDGVYDAFLTVATHNGWESKAKVYFDYFDESKSQEAIFSFTTSMGQNGLQRWQFLEKLSSALPSERAHFGKHLDDIHEASDGKLIMKFRDGSTAEADAIVGCDGIHSRVREILVGSNSPAAHPTYSHKYAYRGLVPMEKAVEALGDEIARNSCNFLGEKGHVLTFPINGGKTMNVVAFYSDPTEWENTQKLTRSAKREDALHDFQAFGPIARKTLELVEPNLDVWAIFDLGNPVPYFSKGRIAIAGDAAHATSPHHGSGAGFAIEDSACMAELLADERVRSMQDLGAAFAAYDAARRERGQWLVQSSRFTGRMYDLELGDDTQMIEREVNERYKIINNVDIKAMCDEAREDLGRRLMA